MDQEILRQVRIFNRYITAKLSIFNRYALGTRYSLAEGRIIGEIGRNPGCSAHSIAGTLQMDKSYLSRLLTRLETADLITRVPALEDIRKKCLRLTPQGQDLYLLLEELSDRQVEDMLSGVSTEDTRRLLESMAQIRSLLGDS